MHMLAIECDAYARYALLSVVCILFGFILCVRMVVALAFLLGSIRICYSNKFDVLLPVLSFACRTTRKIDNAVMR